MHIILELYLAFFKIGLLTFGGGYAMLPMLQNELITKRDWITEEEFLDYFAISQITPGIIAVNTATFVGNKKGGVPGAIWATLGVVSPSIVIIIAIAAALNEFSDFAPVQSALVGIRIAVAALMVTIVYRLIKSNVKSALQIIICASAFVLVALFTLSPVYIVLAGIGAGILYAIWSIRK